MSVTCSSPGFRLDTSGAWLAMMPSWPALPGTTTISASPSNTGPSGVITSTALGVVVSHQAVAFSSSARASTSSMPPTR